MLDKEAMSEQSSSVREGAGYDEIYLSRREPEEDFPRSSEKELSADSLSDKEEIEEEEDEGEVKGDEYDKGEDEKDEEEDKGNLSDGVKPVRQEDRGACPFILPAI